MWAQVLADQGVVAAGFAMSRIARRDAIRRDTGSGSARDASRSLGGGGKIRCLGLIEEHFAPIRSAPPRPNRLLPGGDVLVNQAQRQRPETLWSGAMGTPPSGRSRTDRGWRRALRRESRDPHPRAPHWTQAHGDRRSARALAAASQHVPATKPPFGLAFHRRQTLRDQHRHGGPRAGTRGALRHRGEGRTWIVVRRPAPQ